MSQQKGKVERSFEYCLERSELALKDELIPELRQEIIHSELSPDKAWREAKRRLQKLRTTVELNKEDEGLSRSYWWLAKTKRDHREKFEKLIKKEEKEMGEKKTVALYADRAETYIKRGGYIMNVNLEYDVASDSILNAMHFLVQTEIETCEDFDRIDPKLVENFRNKIIQILEKQYGLDSFIEVLEKSGMKVKFCGNCKNFKECPDGYIDICGGRPRTFQGSCELMPAYERGSGRNADERRENCWAPKEKEVSEKKTDNSQASKGRRNMSSDEIAKRIQRKSAALSM